MPVYYPQINAAGVVAPMRSRGRLSFATDSRDQPSGRRYARTQIDEPLFGITMPYRRISDAEVEVLRSFYSARKGGYETFLFPNPWGNLVPNSKEFSDPSWTLQAASVGLAVADPFGGTLATNLVSSSSDSWAEVTVVPDGDLPANYVLCASAWANAPGASRSMRISLRNSSSEISGRTWNLPDSAWRRIRMTAVVNTSDPIVLRIGGGGTWNTGALALWCPQVVPGPGPGAEQPSPGVPGLPVCEFGMREFVPTAAGMDDNSVDVVIQEVR